MFLDTYLNMFDQTFENFSLITIAQRVEGQSLLSHPTENAAIEAFFVESGQIKFVISLWS